MGSHDLFPNNARFKNIQQCLDFPEIIILSEIIIIEVVSLGQQVKSSFYRTMASERILLFQAKESQTNTLPKGKPDNKERERMFLILVWPGSWIQETSFCDITASASRK